MGGELYQNVCRFRRRSRGFRAMSGITIVLLPQQSDMGR